MIGLLAVVYDKEQSIQKNSTSSGYRSNRRRFSESKDNKRSIEKSIKSNTVRNKHEETGDPDEMDKKQKVYSALKAKAELYEQLATGCIKEGKNSFLVNFDNKISQKSEDNISQEILLTVRTESSIDPERKRVKIEDESKYLILYTSSNLCVIKLCACSF